MTFPLRKILQLILKCLAKIYLCRTSPTVIVIAGTTNRHWIKEYIAAGMKELDLSCRASKKNFNAEIGLPLSVLGVAPDTDEDSRFKRWVEILLKSMREAFWGAGINYLILEMAIDQPDDMSYLLSIVQPQVAIFTAITMIYPENFSGLDEIAREYQKLIKSLPTSGLAVLNADDRRIHELKVYAASKVISYGITNQNADYLADNITKGLDGQAFAVHFPDLKTKEVKISRFGAHHIYAELAKTIIVSNIQNL